MTLAQLKERLDVVISQISNEKLTGDLIIDYKIRKTTYDLYDERNRLKRKAYHEYNASL